MGNRFKAGLFVVLAAPSLMLTLLSVPANLAAQGLDRPALTEAELMEGSKKEKMLVFYSSIPIGPCEAVLKKFKEKYPWIETNFIRGGGPVLGQRFYAEKAQGIEQADVINSGAAELFPDWRRLKYLAKIDNLPEYTAVRDIAKDGGYYVAFSFCSMPIFWNTKLLKAEQVPDDLWEFTKPEWKDKTAAGNPAVGGAPMNWFSWVCDWRKQHPMSKRPPSGLGIKWMQGMKANGILLPGQVGNLTNAIVSGQRSVAVQQWIGEVARAAEEGAPIDYKYPKQGTMGQHWVGGINAKAPHPYTARLFLNWCLSSEGQILLIKKLGFHSVRVDTDTSKYFPLKRGIIPFDQMWVMDLESITPEETKDFVAKVTQALGGESGK